MHHVRLPVSDVLASQDWYERTLDFRPVLVSEEEDAVTGVVMKHTSGVVIGLHLEPERARALAGFALLGLSVDDLVPWLEHLDGLNVQHGGIVDGHLGACVQVRDPDGLVLELHTPDQPSADEA
jgi:catechol 2,3-dioxygenase-like lactoylglutathione lyase family enzyme